MTDVRTGPTGLVVRFMRRSLPLSAWGNAISGGVLDPQPRQILFAFDRCGC